MPILNETRAFAYWAALAKNLDYAGSSTQSRAAIAPQFAPQRILSNFTEGNEPPHTDPTRDDFDSRHRAYAEAIERVLKCSAQPRTAYFRAALSDYPVQ
jgi:hypothetical protein